MHILTPYNNDYSAAGCMASWTSWASAPPSASCSAPSHLTWSPPYIYIYIYIYICMYIYIYIYIYTPASPRHRPQESSPSPREPLTPAPC